MTIKPERSLDWFKRIAVYNPKWLGTQAHELLEFIARLEADLKGANIYIEKLRRIIDEDKCENCSLEFLCDKHSEEMLSDVLT